jgi:hypothetical protein
MYGREERVMEHDVKHRLLVERLRGDGHVRFSNARYWFLTQDSKLPRYASTTLDGDPVEMPFCVSTSAWAQVMGAFTPRTADYDQTIVDLLATPYVRYRGAINPRVVEEVVGRIDQFEGADASLASEVLADTALVRDIAQAESDDDRLAKIENAFVIKAQELRRHLEEAVAREAETRDAAAEAADDAELEAAHRALVEDALRQEREERERTEQELRDRVAEEAAARLRAENQALEATAAAERERQEREAAEHVLGDQISELRRLLRWVAAGVLIAIGLGVGIGPLVSGALSGAWAIVIALCSGALLVAAGLVMGLGAKHGGRVVAWLVAAVGFVGTVYTLVDALG